MKDIFEVLANISRTDLLTMGAIISPVAISIWAAIHWAYKTRLDQLQKSLDLTKADRNLEISKALEAVRQANLIEIQTIEQKLEKVESKYGGIWRAFSGFHELSQYPIEHKQALRFWWRKYDDKYFYLRQRRMKELCSEFYDENEPKKKPRLVLEMEKLEKAEAKVAEE